MSQGALCPNLSQKVQKEVSQIANCNLPIAMLKKCLTADGSINVMSKFQVFQKTSK